MEDANKPSCKAGSVPKSERCLLANCPNAGKGVKKCELCSGPVVWKDAKGRSHGVARSCHNCPNDGLGLPVCYAACPGPNQGFQTDGQDLVTLGSLEDPDGFLQDERQKFDRLDDEGDSVISAIASEPDDPRTAYDKTVTKCLSQDSENACRIVLSEIFSMPLKDLIAFSLIVQGYGFADSARIITKDVGISVSKQAIHKRTMKLRRENRVVGTFIPDSLLREMEEQDRNADLYKGFGHTQQDELFGTDEIIRMNTYSRRYAESRKQQLAEIRMRGAYFKRTGLDHRDAQARAREAL